MTVTHVVACRTLDNIYLFPFLFEEKNLSHFVFSSAMDVLETFFLVFGSIAGHSSSCLKCISSCQIGDAL